LSPLIAPPVAVPAEEKQSSARPRRTTSVRQLAREILRHAAEVADVDLDDYDRPVTRADCEPGGINEQRPCPFVSCKHHLYLEVNPSTGSLKLNFPDREVWELAETCALDVAERVDATDDRATLVEIGRVLNLTRERIRQIEEDAKERAQRAKRRMERRVVKSDSDKDEP